MLGAIAGDIAGSAYEWNKVADREFPLFPAAADFTDDSVLTIAVAEAILRSAEGGVPDYRRFIHDYGRKWKGRGYGGMFRGWLASSDPKPYNSYGNGSAMRVSPVAWAYNDEATVLRQAAHSAEVTHNHPEGIKGAQSIALAIFLARTGETRDAIRSRIEREFDYDLQRSVEQIRPVYSFDETCQGSVPESIIAFMDSNDFESAVRNGIWLGGDADTQACIAGSIAEAFFGGVPSAIGAQVRKRLDSGLLAVIDEFMGRFQE
jgi:ADP-ribosylglycohydrolase